MKISKTVKWIALVAICNMNAQNNFSINFSANTKPLEHLKTNDYNFGVDYNRTFDSKFKIGNTFVYNYKNVDNLESSFTNTLSDYYEIRNKFTVTYFKKDKIHFGFTIEPFLASENNIKIADIDVLGEWNTNFILSSNKALKIGVSRNNFFGKTMILPVFSFNYDYNKKLNLIVGFPESKVSYSNNIRNVFAIKNAFNGSVYNLESPNLLSLQSTKASFSQLTTSLEYERNIENNWFVNLKTGYDFNRKYLLLDNNYNTTFDYKIKDGYNFGITIKYKY